jgi:CDGSH-type Zn-finger protein/uncharacterized Fe-S cluster protein YjdI
MTDGAVETVTGRSATIRFDGRRCIHARRCVLSQPTVFKANVEGPWIDPDAASAEALLSIALNCPSGAIQVFRRDGGDDETNPKVNTISVRENGPLAINAEIVLTGASAGMRATLCRCGASKNKPYCDGSHHEIGFAATGEPPSGDSAALPARAGVLAVDPQPNGPLRVRGNLEIVSGTGRVVARTTTTFLCRCGGSASKPFCDGTHARIGFRS